MYLYSLQIKGDSQKKKKLNNIVECAHVSGQWPQANTGTTTVGGNWQQTPAEKCFLMVFVKQ
jgi:hypothetical protein